MVGTFGRSFFILDDYSPLRELTPQTLTEEARLYPVKNPWLITQGGLAPAGAAGVGTLGGNVLSPNPPVGANFAYSVGQTIPAGTDLVLTVTDARGQRVREIALDRTAGFRRVVWNLRGEAPAGGPARGGRGGAGLALTEGSADAFEAEMQQGRGGGGGFGPLVDPGTYHAQLGKKVGDVVTPIGPMQTFRVLEVS